MDSDLDIRELIRNLIGKFFSNNEISQDIQNVDIGEDEMRIICRNIFNDICDLSSPIINQDVMIDLELFEGIGTDRENSIYSAINLTKTNLGGFLLKKILENPTKETKLLESLQSIIRKIVDTKINEMINNFVIFIFSA